MIHHKMHNTFFKKKTVTLVFLKVNATVFSKDNMVWN